MYVHVLVWPIEALYLDGFAGKVEYAQLLNDGSELPIIPSEIEYQCKGCVDSYQADPPTMAEDTLTLQLPVQKPNVTMPVIELFFARESDWTQPRKSAVKVKAKVRPRAAASDPATDGCD
jgi:alpha-L-fucosidase